MNNWIQIANLMLSGIRTVVIALTFLLAAYGGYSAKDYFAKHSHECVSKADQLTNAHALLDGSNGDATK